MELDLYAHGDRLWEKDFLASYRLDVRLFEALGLEIRQIVPGRTSYRITTDKGMFCLKKLRFKLEEMNFVIQAAEHLKNNGFDCVFDIIWQDDGSFLYEFNHDKYYLTQWIDGKENDFLNPMDLYMAVDTLVQFHNCSCGFVPDNLPENRDYLGKWIESFKLKLFEIMDIKQTILGRCTESSFKREYIRNVESIISEAEEAVSLIDVDVYQQAVDAARRQKSFIHHDFGHNNIIHTFDGRTYLQDLDFCVLDLRIHDLGSFILRCMKKSNWDVDKAFHIIDCYNDKKPLSRDELKLLVPFLLFPQDFWQLTKQYCKDLTKCDSSEYMEKVSRKIEYASLRKRFIDEFARKL
ncbi:MAG: CotS family spore coat protein [Bacillota bacterium]